MTAKATRKMLTFAPSSTQATEVQPIRVQARPPKGVQLREVLLKEAPQRVTIKATTPRETLKVVVLKETRKAVIPATPLLAERRLKVPLQKAAEVARAIFKTNPTFARHPVFEALFLRNRHFKCPEELANWLS